MKAGEHGVIATEGSGANPSLSAKMKGCAVRCILLFWHRVDSNVSLPPPVADEGRRAWRDSDRRKRSESLSAPKEKGAPSGVSEKILIIAK